MQNVTISLNEEILRLTEAEAQNVGKSLSDYISSVLAENVDALIQMERRRASQIEAVDRLRNAALLPLSENGRMPNADERNARR